METKVYFGFHFQQQRAQRFKERRIYRNMTDTLTMHKASVCKPWLKYYDKESVAAPIPHRTAYAYLKEANASHLNHTALHYYGTKITYAELFEHIDAAASAFAALGVKQGDIVSFVSVAVPECVAAIYALNKLGATANTIDPRMDKESIRRMIRESGSQILVVIDAAFPKILPIMEEIGQKHIIVQSVARSLPLIKKVIITLKNKAKISYQGDALMHWDTFLACGKGTVAKEAPYVGDATVAIAYTGGTTGFPKGVMLTNDSVNSVSYNFKYAGLCASAGDRFLGIIPVFTSYGMVCGMHMPLCMGFELILIPRFVPTTIGALVKKFRPNHMISTPAFYELLMDSREMRNMDLSFLITMGSGGDTMNEGLEGKLQNFMKSHNIRYPLAQGYGMSELSAAASFCVNDIYKPGSVGIPSLSLTVSVFHPDTGEEMEIGQEGEICVTGPSMMKGYYNRPEETENVMRRHGDGKIWIHSGDIGYMDEDGFLYIIGRVKRMITRFDGHKVFPVNIESMVSEREDVRNCCVIGVNDREHSQGQYPMVCVELAEGIDREAVCREIYENCQERLEERGRPVAVVTIDQIPLTGAGKNDYRALEKEYRRFDYTAN